MGIFRSFFGRKSAARTEIWEPPAPRSDLGLPPIEVTGRTEPGPATPGGYRPAYREDSGIQAVEDVPEPPAPEPEPAVPVLVPPPRPVANIRAILAEIETLGDSPELGLLRETLGADPDGLFGFSTMYPPALITLLRNRFAGTGARENLVTKPAWGHHYIVDQRYGFTWKSAIRVGQMADDAVLDHESARLTRLRDQLIRNLAGNKRLFVYAGPASPDHIASIRAAMRGYGANTLLHLVIAGAGNAAGEVAWQEEGLLRGTLSRYGNRDGEWDIAVDDWIAVCRAAHEQWKHSTRP
jgi:hypothetical protein